jgi:DNA-binding protein HU-beta
MVNKKKLATKLSKRTMLTQKEAVKVVEEIFNCVVEELVEGNDVSIVGFGKFYLYTHSPRPVRNPKTQEPMILDSYKSLRFKGSDKIKNLLILAIGLQDIYQQQAL